MHFSFTQLSYKAGGYGRASPLTRHISHLWRPCPPLTTPLLLKGGAPPFVRHRDNEEEGVCR
ncbi:hypothetical protein HanIR_Chr07g0341731 [Helianthus annuus]|nr:hypothetical protein HanIR_Chr07g0341731 [Helianthus annuus]